MAIDYNALALPKGLTKKQLKARAKRADAKGLQSFRDAVWARDRKGTDPEWARCAHCQMFVLRKSHGQWTLGEVHHRIPRSVCTKAQRYDPSNGTILCKTCHQLAQTHQITV